MKYLIYSDCHFSQYSSIVRTRGNKYSTRLENLIKSISWAEHLADENNCDEIIMLGDFFDRSDLNAEELTALQDVYFSNLPHTFLTGNHDANISNLEFSTVQLFKSINANIIIDPCTRNINNYVDFYFIPYLTSDKLMPIKNYLLDNDKKKIIFSHNDLAGIQYGKFTSQSGFDVDEILSSCDLFLNGHLHNGCYIENKIILVGSLTGQNFNEDAFSHYHYAYILTISDDKIDLEPFENPYAFNFYKLNINKKKDLDIFNKIKNNAVASISCNSKYIEDVSNIIKDNDKLISYRLITNYDNSSQIKDLVDLKVEDHLQQFIDYVQTKIEPSDILTDELANLKNS